MNRSQFRDKLLYPLRKELINFTDFYVNSRQIVTTSIEEAEALKTDISGIQLEVDCGNLENDLPF